MTTTTTTTPPILPATATAQVNRITQEYYDEICLENVDVFDLTPEEAVQETEQQLQQSSSGGAASSLSLSSSSQQQLLLDHLSRTFPTSSQGQKERSQIQHFLV